MTRFTLGLGEKAINCHLSFALVLLFYDRSLFVAAATGTGFLYAEVGSHN